ncbi:MAG TPA: MaoC/PaaZ C-terminal domain-containing protein [Acidimicrobiia bacterium]|nr:MaoC/PaaZ C-terminal domain-containing protein [Acidimicrobiia bacterium]
MTTPRIKIGEHYGPSSGRIDHDAAIAYAHATDDPNPVYDAGGAVPPLYTVSLVLQAYLHAQSDSVEPGAIEGVRGGVHAEHDLWVHRPLAPGADVTWEVTPSGAQQTKAGVLVAQRIVVSDDRGPALEHYWTTLFMGGTIPEPLGTPLVDHTFPEAAREHVVGAHTFTVARDQAFRYAGASNDHAPMHVDDEAARRAGFPSKFMQGMCSLAMCSGAVVKIAADGDPDRLRRLACRFSAPTYPGNELEVTVYDAGPSGEGTHSVAFEATSAGVTVIKHGRADIAA